MPELPVFSTLQAVTFEWLGVKYHHLGRTKGGVDCAHLVGCIFKELGILNYIEPELYYARDWYIHGDDEILLDGLARHIANYAPGYNGTLYDYEPGFSLLTGDVLCMKLRNPNDCCHHAALYLPGNKIIQALEQKGVFITDFSYRWPARTYKVFRLSEAT